MKKPQKEKRVTKLQITKVVNALKFDPTTVVAKKILADEKLFNVDYIVRRVVEKLSTAVKSDSLDKTILEDCLQDLTVARVKMV